MSKASSRSEMVVIDPSVLITELEAAKLLSVSARSLQNWRVRGGGPQFIKMGGRIVRYRHRDISDWIDSQARNNTSQGRA